MTDRKHDALDLSVNKVVNRCNYILSFPRSASKDRAERSVPSGEKPAAAHREGNLKLCKVPLEMIDFILCI